MIKGPITASRWWRITAQQEIAPELLSGTSVLSQFAIVEPNNEIRIVASKDPQPGNWLKLQPQSSLAFTLTLFSPANSVKGAHLSAVMPRDRAGQLLVKQRLFWILADRPAGNGVHLAYVLFVPKLEMGRLLTAGSSEDGANKFIVLPEREAVLILGQQSQAFVQGICVFDLGDGPVHVKLETPQSYWMANVYSRSGDNIYSLNDRQISEVPFSIVIERQKSKLFGDEPDEQVVQDVAFKVATGTTRGLFVVRVFVQDPAYRTRITRILERSTCRSAGNST